MKRFRRKIAGMLAWILCSTSLLQPVSAAGMREGELPQEQETAPEPAKKELSLSVREGKGSLVLREGETEQAEVTEEKPAKVSVSEDIPLTVELLPAKGYEVAFYRTLTDGGEEKENLTDCEVLNAEAVYRTGVLPQELSALEAGFCRKAEVSEAEETDVTAAPQTVEEPEEGVEETAGQTEPEQGESVLQIPKGYVLNSRGRAVSTDKTVSLSIGEEIHWGSYVTRKYQLQDGSTVFCLEPLKKTPDAGIHQVSEVRDYKAPLTKALYYLYGGPGFAKSGLSTGDSAVDYAISHYMAAYIFDGCKDTGDGNALGLLDGTAAQQVLDKYAELQKLSAPPENACTLVFDSGYNSETGEKSQIMGLFAWKENRGSVAVQKTSANPELTDGNDCYSLQGAQYGVFQKGTDTRAALITTDAKGYGKADEIPEGEYDIREVTAPKGYALDKTVGKVTVTADKVTTYPCTDKPQSDPVRVLLGKVDKETNQNKPQGSASLANAEFTVKFYKGNHNVDPASQGQQPERTWVLKTREDGKTFLLDTFKVSGDDFYYMSTGDTTLPLGTLTIQETKAPTGYLLNPEVFVRQITSEGNLEGVETYNAPTIPEQPQKGVIRLEKRDKDTDRAQAQGVGSLQGAVYGVFASDGSEVDTLTTDGNGAAQSRELPLGTYTVREQTPSAGYSLDGNTYTVSLTAENATDQIFYGKVQSQEAVLRGGVAVEKWDSGTDRREPQGEAQLAGTKIRLLSKNPQAVLIGGKSYAKDEVITTLVTDADGKASTASNYLPYGDYRLEEIVPPVGYNGTGVTVRDFSIRENGEVVQMNTSDTALKNEVFRGGVMVEKWDIETEAPVAQGAASLEGAEIQILSKNPHTVLVDGKPYENGDIITTLVTDREGKAATKTDYLPYGTYLLKESVPPAGYNHTGQISRTFSLRNQGEVVRMNTSDTAIKNEVIRGDVRIVKFGSKQENEEGNIRKPLKDIEFTFTSKNTGEQYTILTDENGYADTKQLGHKRGGLVYDTYVVTEKSPYEDYEVIRPFEVTISEEQKMLYYIVENDVIEAPVSVVKKDATTGRVIPVKGTAFRILDEDKKVLSMTVTHYPSLIRQDIWETDETGSFMLPEKLKAGTYYLEEVNAPKGYLKGELLKFKVSESSSWEKPLVVEYEDVPVMGRIAVEKSDKVTGEKLKGAVFAVFAEEDIITPDGTVRAVKDEVVDTLTTDEKGRAQSKDLYLGHYLVKEIKPAPGFVLSDKSHAVELKYRNQTTELVTETLEIQNKPTVLVIDKKVTGSKQRLSGVKFAVWNKAAAEGEDSEMALKSVYTTAKNGEIRLERLLPGDYCLQETEGLAGYAADPEIHEITVDENGRIKGKGKATMTVENAKTEIVGTTAVSLDTDGHEAATKKETVLTDTVKFQNLQPGAEIRVQGILMDKESGKELLVDGKPVTAETVFTAEGGEQEIENVFRFDASALLGKEIVVFEKAFIGEIEIAAHEDLEDKAQAVRFPTPEIGTSAKDETTGTQEAAPKKETTIVDTVQYKNLIVGQEYTVKGVLMDKETGKELLVDEKPVTAEKTFIPKEKNGSVELKFTFDASALLGKEVVVFERMYVEETEVAVHTDIKDKGQTVEFPTPEIGTSAKDEATGTQEAAPKKETTIVDTVQYKDLIVGQEYTVKGVLMDKETGGELLVDEKPVTAEKTFVPEEKNGSVELKFTFDASALLGREVVVFERMYVEETEVAVHTDIKDKGQTVEFPTPEIGTTAKNEATGTQEAAPKKETTIVDTVQYKNLIVGQEYTVKGVLMDKETGKELLVDEKPVTAEKTFVPEEKNGSVKLKFTFDASALLGKEVVVFERMYVEETEVAVHTDLEDKGQTVEFPTPEIGTSAKDETTGTQEAAPKKETTIIDTVQYKDLIVGQEYTVKGVLMDKGTGKELLVDEKPVTAEKTFVPEEKNGSVKLKFTFDASALLGKEVVVFERMYVEETEVAVHTDLEDKGQTVEFPTPEIGTSAKNEATGTQEAAPKKETTIVDTVKYKNLIVGQEYTVKGVLMDKGTGKELLVDGKPVTAEKTFTPKEKNGSVELKFTFDASALGRKTLVVFERLYVEETEVAAHADLRDKAQTVRIKDIGKIVTSMQNKNGEGRRVGRVRTGDEAPLVPLVLLSLASVCVVILMAWRRKKRTEEKHEE